MTRRRAWRLAIALLLLAGVGVLLIGLSHVPNLFATRAEHEGQPTSHWIKALASPDAETRQFSEPSG